MLLAIVCLSFSVGETYAQKHEFANYKRYATENAALAQPVKKEKRVVFMGNSITEGWVRTHPDFFKTNGYIGRGISGQTSYQFLLRFREDVINLSPALVVINAGTNDVAENTGASVSYTHLDVYKRQGVFRLWKFGTESLSRCGHLDFGPFGV